LFLSQLLPPGLPRAPALPTRRDILVRIIEYTFDDPGRPGSGEPHRLLTTLLDEELDPAETLIVLSHERWEEELTIDGLKTHQRERPVPRSQTPAGGVQELYGLLRGHDVIRMRMHKVPNRPGRDVAPGRKPYGPSPTLPARPCG
jgi:hypothetical protein